MQGRKEAERTMVNREGGSSHMGSGNLAKPSGASKPLEGWKGEDRDGVNSGQNDPSTATPLICAREPTVVLSLLKQGEPNSTSCPFPETVGRLANLNSVH